MNDLRSSIIEKNIDTCDQYERFWSEWERAFIGSMKRKFGRGRKLSHKEFNKLHELAEKLPIEKRREDVMMRQ